MIRILLGVAIILATVWAGSYVVHTWIPQGDWRGVPLVITFAFLIVGGIFVIISGLDKI